MNYEDLGFTDEAPAPVAPPQQQSPANNQQGQQYGQARSNNGYQGGGSNGGSGGGYNKSGSPAGGFGGGKRFQKAPEIETDIPYVPIAFYVDSTFPPEIKAKLKEQISLLLSKQFVVRVNVDDKEFIDSIKGLSDTQLEIYLPWGKINEADGKRYFNDIESKHYFNTASSKMIAQKFFPAWDKVPDAVKAFLARNTRLLFGDKNNSCVTALVTWSEDGASKTLDISRTTGKASHAIKMAAYYNLPIFNIQNKTAEEALAREYSLY